MSSYRHQLLETFGLDADFSAIGTPDIQLKNNDEAEPFGEIVTTEEGKTVLRVGQVLTRGPIFTVRR